MNLTGGEVVARSLKEYGVEYVAAIPGHGAWAMLDALYHAYVAPKQIPPGAFVPAD